MTQCHRCALTLIPLALALVVVAMDAQAGPPPGRLTLEPYTFSSRGGETIEAVMGTLVVPYDRSRGDSETIALKFVRFRATTDDPGPPLVYLAGGPGGSGIGAGTVKMATNLGVDLRELFVMPRVAERPPPPTECDDDEVGALMDLAAMRALLKQRLGKDDDEEGDDGEAGKRPSTAAVDQIMSSQRTVIIGPPGAGKSTFVEWLQLQLAGADLEWVLNGHPAIPLLIRVRQLDAKNLPRGRELIKAATGSADRAALMPDGWIERQMQAGRIAFILDGLDEIDPDDRDKHLLPWLDDLCRPEHSKGCRFLVTSRPVGYPPGALSDLEFVECDLLDFEPDQVEAYARNWCTAVHLAQHESEEESRRSGDEEGKQFVEGFKDHPYIPDLARNPLMLSAICLVNYFEGGRLPDDRAMLYKLCVEGLLHHWDQRRGIHSEYSLQEKIRVCRETAIAMQADDKAEYAYDDVLAVFTATLNDEARAKALLEHIRYRTGLLLERRPGVFAFAHLTFQEYLAALAVIEGNQRGVDADQLVRQHADARWPEVIALYCGAAPAASARTMIDTLMEQADSACDVLVESYFAASSKVAHDRELKEGVIRRLATISWTPGNLLRRFSATDVAPIANELVGQTHAVDNFYYLAAYQWLIARRDCIDGALLVGSLKDWRSLDLDARERVNILLHIGAGDPEISEFVNDALDFYKSEATDDYSCEADCALKALCYRAADVDWDLGCDAALETCLRTLAGMPRDLWRKRISGLDSLAILHDGRARLRRVDREVLVQLAARIRESRGDHRAPALLNLLTSIINEHESPGAQSSDESSSLETGGVT